jgi:hypothetical protein
MYATPVKSTVKPAKSRLGLKIAAIFTGTFLAVFLGLLFWDLFLMLGERVLTDRAVADKAPVTAIDPKLESDLAKVLENNDVQNTADIKNPFADKTGISNSSSATLNSTVAQQNPATKSVNPAAAKLYPQKTQSQQTVAAKNVAASSTVQSQPVQETRTRLQIREARIQLGQDGGPESMVFAIDDLLPVGTVSGGDGKEEVMFFSESACRVVSFPVGTQFYDGWFDSMRPEGVVFAFFDELRTRRMRAWGRSVEQKCSQSISITPSPNQAIITGGGE